MSIVTYEQVVGNAEQQQQPPKRDPMIRFLSPSEMRSYDRAEQDILVGDAHVMRGEIFVIGGEPGVGKSTAATELAICGATGRDWIGLPVKNRFKTMVIQTENGRFRLKNEYDARGLGGEIEDYIRVSEPPPYGITLNNPHFRDDFAAALHAFEPDVVILDPWNAAAKDDKQKDYVQTFDTIRDILPKGDKKPAFGIVAHTRKPKPEDVNQGPRTLQRLSGSGVLGGTPRCVMLMLRATNEETDDRVIWINCKNNNGNLITRTVWHRSPSGFTPASEFDWEEFDNPKPNRRVITLEDIEEALGGEMHLRRDAVKLLMDVTEMGERACQKALWSEGKFSHNLRFTGEFVGLLTRI